MNADRDEAASHGRRFFQQVLATSNEMPSHEAINIVDCSNLEVHSVGSSIRLEQGPFVATVRFADVSESTHDLELWDEWSEVEYVLKRTFAMGWVDIVMTVLTVTCRFHEADLKELSSMEVAHNRVPHPLLRMLESSELSRFDGTQAYPLLRDLDAFLPSVMSEDDRLEELLALNRYSVGNAPECLEYAMVEWRFMLSA